MKFKKNLKLKFIDKFRKHIILMFWRFNRVKLQQSTKTNKRFLIASNIGGNLNTLALDLVLANALRSRGHHVDVTLCNKALPACMYCELNKYDDVDEFIKKGSSKLCNSCFSTGKQALSIYGFKSIQMEKHSTNTKLPYQESAISGTKRFLARSTLLNDSQTDKIREMYLEASKISRYSFNEILKNGNYNSVIAHHGIYVPQGDVSVIANELNVPIYTWVQGYRKGSYLFAKNDTYHKTLMSESEWERELSPDETNEISNYLLSREAGTNDWIKFAISSKWIARADLGFPSEKGAIFVAFTNVSWDAQLHYSSNIFDNMFDWLEETINFFIMNKNLNLVIRIHPAEITGAIKSQEPTLKWINNRFNSLPANIKIIGPEADLSSYSLISVADVGIIYASKVGLEFATSGKPLIVCGEAWIKNKNFTNDPRSVEEYFQMLQSFAANPNMLRSNKELALQYAYYFFFRRCIKLESIKPIKYYPYALPKLKANWQETDDNLLKLVKAIEQSIVPVLP